MATEGQISLRPSRCVQIQDSTPPQSSPYKGEDALRDFFLTDNLKDDLTPDDPHETRKSLNSRKKGMQEPVRRESNLETVLTHQKRKFGDTTM